MKPVNIFIADDSQIHIEGVKYIVKNNRDINIIGEAYSPDEAKQALRKKEPDVMLLDISMEEEADGLDLAYYVKENFPSVKVIILSHYKKFNYIIKALYSNVRAYLAKDTSAEELTHAIFTVNRGNGIYLGETLPYKDLLNVFGTYENLQKRKPYDLTQREMEVIEWLANGYCTKEIALELNINKNTVETHKEHIKDKLGVRSAIEIVVFAIKHHIIDIEQIDN